VTFPWDQACCRCGKRLLWAGERAAGRLQPAPQRAGAAAGSSAQLAGSSGSTHVPSLLFPSGVSRVWLVMGAHPTLPSKWHQQLGF